MKRAVLSVVLTSMFGEAGSAQVPEILPLSCEASLALSAAPEYLRDQAGIYALTESGFQKMRESGNQFTCIVNRDHPRVLKPTCFDAEGTASILPKVIYVGDQLVKGVDISAINDDIARKFDDGTFVKARRPGVAYMLSRYNRPVNPQTGKLGFFPPHVMFYAPDLTNADIGHDMNFYNSNQPTPMIGYQGPHGYMLMISDDGRQRARSDLDPSCPDWIWDEEVSPK